MKWFESECRCGSFSNRSEAEKKEREVGVIKTKICNNSWNEIDIKK